MIDNFAELNNLSEKEKAYALEILKEYSKKGKSDKYNDLLYSEYDELPVDIKTFLHDTKYLGKALTDEEGRFTIFPYWEKVLCDIFPDPLKPAQYNILALTGSIGIGKSTIAVICVLYDLYRMLCLKNPYVHYGLQPIDLITFAVINITLDAAKGVAWNKLQSMIQASDWFMARGTLSKGETPEWRPPKGIELIYGSMPRHIIGRAVFGCFVDEVSFQPNQDVNKQIEKAKNLVNTALARMQSRFMRGESNPTLMIIASSKRTEQSYMETFIAEKRANESKTTYVVDEPQWIIRTDKNSDRKFKVAVGNKFLASELLPLNATEQDARIYRDRGYSIIDVPMGYYENFRDDIDVALTDIAGISTTNLSKYISGARLSECKNDNYKNPFTKEIIEVGNAPDDKVQYSDFFDLTRVDSKMKSRPMFIHLDMSISGDKTGIAGVWIKGKKPSSGELSSNDLYYQLAFAVSIKAPKGHQVSFEKNRNFIRWLREQGFIVKGISTDSFQAYDTGQQLKSEGFNYTMISVDKVNQDHVCIPYQYFKSVIYEKRIEMFEDVLLTEEIINLEKNNNNGHIDHPSGGGKDKSDAVCGALYNASQHAEEFAFDYGETIDTILDTNVYSTPEYTKQQLSVDFQQELARAFNPMKQTSQQDDHFLDFGMGKAEVINAVYASDGILLW